MTPQQILDFRLTLGILSILLAVGLVLIGALIGVSIGDRRALTRSGKNGVLEILVFGKLRTHVLVLMLGAGFLWVFGHRAVFGTPVGPLIRVVVLLISVAVVICYAALESMDRWKIRFYFRDKPR